MSSLDLNVPSTADPLPKPAVTNLFPEQTVEVEKWKHRPPYLVPPDDEFGPVKWRGKCQCGQITYKLNREKPLNAKFCHCRGCQVMHGAPFQWAAIFHKSDMYFTKGASGLTFYSSAHRSREYETPTKVCCSFCRSPIMDEGRRMCLVFPESIDIGESPEERQEWRAAFDVNCHIFYANRVLEITDGKKKWAGIDDNSELLDDEGNPKGESERVYSLE